MTGHQDWDELAAGYALHALAPDEEAAFTQHLETCSRCMANVDDYSLTAAQLGSMAHTEDVAPPEWKSIRDEVIGDSGTPAPVTDLSAQRRRYELSRRALAAAASVAILAGGGVVTWRLTSSSSTTPAAVKACQPTNGCHVVALRASHGGKPAGSIIVADNGELTVMPSRMAAAPKGRTYVVWQVPRDGRPMPVAQFTRAGESVRAHGALSIYYRDLLEFAISVEPSGPLPAKPSGVVAAGYPT